MKKHYIKAVLEMLESGEDATAVLKGLSKILEAKGHTRLHASILRGVYTVLSAKTTSQLPQVIVQSEAALSRQKKEIKEALTEFGAKDDFETVIDETIVGGHIVSYNNMFLDRSYKSALTKLYRSITK